MDLPRRIAIVAKDGIATDQAASVRAAVRGAGGDAWDAYDALWGEYKTYREDSRRDAAVLWFVTGLAVGIILPLIVMTLR